jgi:hypothetical protein
LPFAAEGGLSAVGEVTTLDVVAVEASDTNDVSEGRRDGGSDDGYGGSCSTGGSADDDAPFVGVPFATGALSIAGSSWTLPRPTSIADDDVAAAGATVSVGDTNGERDGFKLGPSCKMARRNEAFTNELDVSSLLKSFIAWFNSTTLCLFCSTKLWRWDTAAQSMGRLVGDDDDVSCGG